MDLQTEFWIHMSCGRTPSVLKPDDVTETADCMLRVARAEELDQGLTRASPPLSCTSTRIQTQSLEKGASKRVIMILSRTKSWMLAAGGQSGQMASTRFAKCTSNVGGRVPWPASCR
eukprot:2032896-Rhodomonas_salina.4